MSAGHRWQGRRAAAVLAMVAAVAWLPGLTGVAAHEWLGLALGAALALHGARRLQRLAGLWAHRGRGRWLVAVDGLLFGALAVCLVSGLMVSGEVLAAFGLYAPGYFLWDPLHAFSAKLLMALVVVHGGANLLGLTRSRRRRCSDGATEGCSLREERRCG